MSTKRASTIIGIILGVLTILGIAGTAGRQVERVDNLESRQAKYDDQTSRLEDALHRLAEDISYIRGKIEKWDVAR